MLSLFIIFTRNYKIIKKILNKKEIENLSKKCKSFSINTNRTDKCCTKISEIIRIDVFKC